MREILFRGKRKDNGEWIEGSSINTQYDVSGKKHVYIGIPVISEMYPLMQTIEWIEVIPETVGQYTGLTDKNGKRIFEGDIVKDSFLLGKVVYATPQDGFDGIAGFMVDDVFDGLQNYNDFWHQVEVIGNIHDNPDLLKGGE